jgi:voltage-gated potassium channel
MAQEPLGTFNRLDRRVARATTPRRAAVVIAVVTTAITLAAGLVMTVVDRDSFPTIGSGLWWAVQTVTTVGYGDHVPESVGGRLVAALVMLLGIGFVTVITASITSAFVSQLRVDQAAAVAEEALTTEQLRKIDERLARIEASLKATS